MCRFVNVRRHDAKLLRSDGLGKQLCLMSILFRQARAPNSSGRLGIPGHLARNSVSIIENFGAMLCLMLRCLRGRTSPETIRNFLLNLPSSWCGALSSFNFSSCPFGGVPSCLHLDTVGRDVLSIFTAATSTFWDRTGSANDDVDLVSPIEGS